MSDDFRPGINGYFCAAQACKRWHPFSPYDLEHKDSSALHLRCECGVVNILDQGTPRPTTQKPSKR